MRKILKLVLQFFIVLLLSRILFAAGDGLNFQGSGGGFSQGGGKIDDNNSVVASAQQEQPNNAQTTSGISFQNADIRAVIEAVAKSTGKNFIVDPRVAGKVTLVSPGYIDPENLYDIFLSILKVHGYIAVEDVGTEVIRILPVNESRVEAELGSNEAQGSPDEIVLELIKINSAKATELIPILRPIVSKNGHLAAHASSNNIIVTDTRSNIDKIQRIIKTMDSMGESEIKTVRLKNATASDIATVLTSILQKGKGAPGAKNATTVSDSFNIVAEKRTNSLILRGSPVEIQRVSSIIEELDSQVNVQSGTDVINLEYAKAKNITEVINKIIIEDKKNPFSSKTHVTFDEDTNSIIVDGLPKDVAKIKNIISRLDTKRSQIMVEALIVEMNADKSTQLGIQWGASYDESGNTSDTTVDYSLGAIIGRIKSGSKLTFGVLASALATDADVNLVSAPSLLTLENEEAVIEVGREVPFKTGSYTSTGSENPTNPFTTISRENVGLKLKITPQISKGGVIKLSIEQEISAVLPTAQASLGASDVVTSKRSLNTNVMIKDGHMLVLGGLIDDNVTETDNRTPGLSRIPLLGYLFRSRETTKEKRNLMIFIRPYIVRDDNARQLLTKNRYNYMRNLQLIKQAQGVATMPGKKQPLIKDIYGTTNNTYRPAIPTRRYKKPSRSFPRDKSKDYGL